MTINRPELPVYVIHWDAPQWCERTVASLLASTGVALRVTVIHNGGTLPRLPHGTRLVSLRSNRGYAGGANVALGERRADWLVVTSHDVVVAPDALAVMLQAATATTGIVGPVGSNVAHGELIRREGRSELREWVSGCCLLIRSKCAESVGPFDERFGSYVEDVDYCLRARDAGWSVRAALDAKVETAGSRSPRARRMIFVNQVLLAGKRGGFNAGLRRLLGHLREAAYRASQHEFHRAADHVAAVPLGFRKLLSLGEGGGGRRGASVTIAPRPNGRAVDRQ